MSDHKKKTGLSATISRLNKSGKDRTLEVSFTILRELGLGEGKWCFQSKAHLNRVMEWYDHVPLFVRVLACIQLSTLGYMPSSAGVSPSKAGAKTALTLDDGRHSHCKKHGALLAVTQIPRGGRVPIGPFHVRNAVNEAAARAFEKQEGRPPTPEEKEAISVPASHVRYALAFLEDLGLCLRTDAEDTPLEELKQTPEGRAKLKTLSGDNKIRIYFYLTPRPSKIKQGSNTLLPSNSISKELKPLQRRLFALNLDISPEALAFDTDLQSLIRTEMDEREKLLSERDEELRTAILAKYPSADVKKEEPEPGPSLLDPPESAAEAEEPAAQPLTSQPRKAKTTEELAPVAEVLKRVEITKAKEVSQIFGNCRDEVSDCTPEEVAAFLADRIVRGKHVGNWLKYLSAVIDTTPKSPGFGPWCKGERDFAKEEESKPRKPAKAESYAERRAREILEQREREGKVSNG